MPVIARIYGILIKMYYLDDEHAPPHIHAKYQGEEGIFNIETGKMTRGSLRRRQIAIVNDFIAKHREALLDMWVSQRFTMLENKED